MLEGVDRRSTKLISLASGPRIAQTRHDGGRDIIDIDRLEPGHAPPEQRQNGREGRQSAEQIEEAIFGAEDNAGADDLCLGQSFSEAVLGGGLGSCIGGRRVEGCADGRDLHHIPNTGRCGRLRPFPTPSRGDRGR